MSTIRILSETKDTVTISRKDWGMLQDELEEAEDRAAVSERRAHERLIRKEAARRDYLTGDEATRLLNGESPVKIWRERRGLSQRALAMEAKLSDSYLAEIETDRKPGSNDAYRKLAAVLQVPPDDLNSTRSRMRQPDYGPVVLCYSPPSAGVAPGHRAASMERREFAALGEALNFVRNEWGWLRFRAPLIFDTDDRPIYLQHELFREMEE